MDKESVKEPVDAVEQSKHESQASGTPRKAKSHTPLPGYTKKGFQRDVQKETHSNVDKSEHETMRENVVHNVIPLVEFSIPDTALDIPAKLMLEGLRKKGLYDGTRWVDWKDKMSEKDCSEFFNKLADAVDEIIEEQKKLMKLSAQLSNDDGDSSPPTNDQPRRKPRRWTHEAMNKALAGDPCKRKPDLICIGEGDEKAWPFVLVGGQVKSSVLEALGAQRQGFGDTKLTLRTQHNRRFVLGCTIVSNMISLYHVDRSGILSSGLFPVHKYPEHFIRIVVGLTLVEPKYLGYDATLSVVGGVGKVTLKGEEYDVLKNIHAESSVLGRGTMCFEVKGHNPERPWSCVMKDAWVDVERAEKEADILKKLNELKITNIPKVVDSEVVQVDGRDDSTKDIRVALKYEHCVAREIKPLPKKALSDDAKVSIPADNKLKDSEQSAQGDSKKTDTKKNGKKKKEVQRQIEAARRKGASVHHAIRNHHRIIVEPYGKEFFKFRCLEEFILAIKDIVSVIKQLYDNRYLHRDISINNIVLAERDEDAFQTMYKRLQGFLIDYDYTISLDRTGSSDARAEATGTVPFMAVEALDSAGKPFAHMYHHDLESLFYVICWICTIYCGPNGKIRNLSEYKSSRVVQWNVQDFSHESLMLVATSKRGFVSMSIEAIEENFHPYFRPLFDCLCKIQNCVFPLGPRMLNDEYEDNKESMKLYEKRTDPEGRRAFRRKHVKLKHHERDPEVIFEELFAAIDEARTTLSEEHRLKQEYPPSSEIQPEAEDDSDDEAESEEEEKPEENEDEESDQNIQLFYNENTGMFINAPMCISVIELIGEDSEEARDVATPLGTYEKRMKSESLAKSGSASLITTSSSSRKRKSPEEAPKDQRPTKITSR